MPDHAPHDDAPLPSRREAAERLADIGRTFWHRGWVPGTSGNFSAVTSRDPLALIITPGGADKGRLDPVQLLAVDASGNVLEGVGPPSDETGLHLEIVKRRGAGAVLHIHSVWSTLVSERLPTETSITAQGLEMLKGLAGVKTHDHVETVPIVANSQDYVELTARLGRALDEFPDCHGLLIRGHGLTTWGQDVEEARRHVETLEFLLEVVGRRG